MTPQKTPLAPVTAARASEIKDRARGEAIRGGMAVLALNLSARCLAESKDMFCDCTREKGEVVTDFLTSLA